MDKNEMYEIQSYVNARVGVIMREQLESLPANPHERCALGRAFTAAVNKVVDTREEIQVEPEKLTNSEVAAAEILRLRREVRRLEEENRQLAAEELRRQQVAPMTPEEITNAAQPPTPLIDTVIHRRTPSGEQDENPTCTLPRPDAEQIDAVDAGAQGV